MKPKKPPQLKKTIAAMALAGLLAAALSGLEHHIPWLGRVCAVFGDGCRDTSVFTLLGIPVFLLGLLYYCVLLTAALVSGGLAFRVVMAGAGVELTFLYGMVVEDLLCFFCIFNFLIIAALTALVLRKGRGWQSLALVLLFFVLSFFPFARENGLRAWQKTPPQPQDIAARVGEKTITESELERAMASQIYDARMGLYVQKIERLNQMIDEILLEAEAADKGLSVEELEEDLLGNLKEVSDREVEEFYLSNMQLWSSWKGTHEALLDRIRGYLEAQRKTNALREHIKGLRDRADVRILLEEPPLPVAGVPLGDSPVEGPPDAPVTVVEFSDYLCSACREAHRIVTDLKEEYEGKVRWVFKDFPLERHQGAEKLAEAARCARDQGLFREYQDMLFRTPERPDDDTLLGFAEGLGLDIQQFRACLKSGAHAQAVLEDIRAGERSGVEVTPTFIINGRIRPGTPGPDEFRRLLDVEIGKAGQTGELVE